MRRFVYLFLLVLSVGLLGACDSMDEVKADPASFLVGKYVGVENILLLNAEGVLLPIKLTVPMGVKEVSKLVDNTVVIDGSLKLDSLAHVTNGIKFAVSSQLMEGRRVMPLKRILTPDEEWSSGFYSTESYSVTVDYIMVLAEVYDEIDAILSKYTEGEWKTLQGYMPGVTPDNFKYVAMQNFDYMMIQLIMKKK